MYVVGDVAAAFTNRPGNQSPDALEEKEVSYSSVTLVSLPEITGNYFRRDFMVPVTSSMIDPEANLVAIAAFIGYRDCDACTRWRWRDLDSQWSGCSAQYGVGSALDRGVAVQQSGERVSRRSFFGRTRRLIDNRTWSNPRSQGCGPHLNVRVILRGPGSERNCQPTWCCHDA